VPVREQTSIGRMLWMFSEKWKTRFAEARALQAFLASGQFRVGTT